MAQPARLSGKTRLAIVIGDPVRHSLSPIIHNAAFAACGLDWVFLACEVPEGRVPDALAGAVALGIEGLSVTMPHKAAVAAAVDELSPTARLLGAVNYAGVRFGGLISNLSTFPKVAALLGLVFLALIVGGSAEHFTQASTTEREMNLFGALGFAMVGILFSYLSLIPI